MSDFVEDQNEETLEIVAGTRTLSFYSKEILWCLLSSWDMTKQMSKKEEDDEEENVPIIPIVEPHK